MRKATKISLLLAVVLAALLVKCHDELTFLQDVHDIPESKDLIFIDSGVNNDLITTNLKAVKVMAAGAVPDYDMYVLSIQWGNTLCLNSDFCKNKIKSLRRNIMTLHGLWPNLKSGSMLPDCNTGKDIPISIGNKDLLTTMQSHWPSYTGPDEKFWTHEYNKHGFCYTNKSKTEGYIPYFSLGMEIFKKLDLENFISDLIDGSHEADIAIKTDDLRALIAKKFPQIKYDFDCKKSGTKSYLAEIRIYFDLDFNSFIPPHGRSDCPASQPIYIGKFIQ